MAFERAELPTKIASVQNIVPSQARPSRGATGEREPPAPGILTWLGTSSDKAIVVLAGAIACFAAATELGLSQPGLARPLVQLPKEQLAKCEASRLLRPACARMVPRVDGRYRAYRARDGTLVPELQVFDLEYFGTPLRPPRGAHITIAAGAVSRLTPYVDPDASLRPVRLSKKVREAARTKPISFGYRRWNGVRGILYLAPPHLHGGQLGDHLVFQWGSSDRIYVVSLHAWRPLAETAATLRAMVATLP